MFQAYFLKRFRKSLFKYCTKYNILLQSEYKQSLNVLEIIIIVCSISPGINLCNFQQQEFKFITLFNSG